MSSAAEPSTGRPPPARGDASRHPARHGDHGTTTFAFAPGAVLLRYADGPVEQRDTDVDDAVRGLTELDLPTAEPLDHLLDTVLDHPVRGVREDDIALLATRRSSPGRHGRTRARNGSAPGPTEVGPGAA
ncbi:SpoIIE family protein phosphatase [Streptomyces griseomycini]|uniref:SpoIIE family protein phosphatase n=1 Tax=Streptomyces griseomycini TaxID=66895 RepID=UPI003422D391